MPSSLDPSGHRRTVIAARTTAAVLLAALTAITGCRDAAAATATCQQYPIPWQPAAGRQGAAQTELASLSPGASLTWNAAAGTLSATTQLSVAMPGCSDGQDVAAQVYGVIAAHPALFQIDLAEWRPQEPYDCKYVTDAMVSVGRVRLAGRPVAKDVFAYAVKRIGGVVHLTGAYGTYLPVLGGATGNAMAACNRLTAAAAAATARRTALQASTYAQCQRTGAVSYTPKSNDAFSLAPDERWTWDAAAQVALSGQRTLRVVIAPANYTPALLASDARCPTPDGDGSQFTIGFDLELDVHTGAIVSVKPGLDCIVC